MKKTLRFLALIFLSLTVSNCDSDDDAASASGSNEFRIGNTSYSLARGYRSDSEQDEPNLFLTNVVLVSSGLNLSNNEELTGTGDILGFEFYTATGGGLQAGTYTIDSLNEDAQTVYVFSGINFNSQTGDADIEDEIFQGTITVEVLPNGNYRITGQGRADDADANFTMNFSGSVQLVN
jgi:hypothetical protein